MSSASRGLAPREGLECLLVKMGCTGPLAEPRHGPQAGKCWDPHSQNADRSMYEHEVWTLTDLPDDRRAIENKWIFKKKTGADGNVTIYKARLDSSLRVIDKFKGLTTMRLSLP